MASFQGLDAQTLVVVHAVISFVSAPFLSPTYNFPLFLFGIYAADRTDSVESLRLFAGFVSASVVFDIIWLAKTSGQNGLIMLLTILNLILKVPTVLACVNSLRMRGDSFASSISAGQFGQFGASQPVWSMPGAFSGRDGYTNVDDDLEGGANTPPPRLPNKSSVPIPSPAAPQQHQQQPAAPAPPGGYQTL
ncbi:hypothetical protein DL93DRAFT_1507756 [Clavulina sp. PMI_390]|nr:hypothetical protein DL93DRAFT_1507756 [Clavulina sp. PMI_390]